MKLHNILLASLILLSPLTAKAAQADDDTVSRDSIMTVIEAAKESDPVALNTLALWYYNICYRYGHGVDQDSLRAAGLYERSVREGNAALFSQLKAEADKGGIFECASVAHFYNDGIGTARDFAQAGHYYGLIARKGDITAMRQAGVAYLNAKDYKKALEWLRKGALAGDTVSEYYYGSMLAEGLGCTADPSSGFVYALKAAEAGNANAMYLVSKLYREGRGVAASRTQADSWLAKAAYKGLAKAIYDYALIAVEKNEITEAAYLFSWLQARNSFVPQMKARFDPAAEGNVLATPFGHYTLAMKAIEAGDFKTAKNEIKALKKDKLGIADILEVRILLSPANEKRDVAKAVKQLAKLSEKDAYAAYLLGLLYERGTEGLEPDPDKALEYLTLASDKGFMLAGDALGNAYYEGSFGARDAALARQAYDAQYSRGVMLAAAASRYAAAIQGLNDALAKKVTSMKYPESIDTYLTLVK